jgi:hypothetical protein
MRLKLRPVWALRSNGGCLSIMATNTSLRKNDLLKSLVQAMPFSSAKAKKCSAARD